MSVYEFLDLGFIHFPTELLICQAIFLIHKQRTRRLGTGVQFPLFPLLHKSPFHNTISHTY